MAEQNNENETRNNSNINREPINEPTQPNPIDYCQVASHSIMSILKNSHTDGLKQQCYQLLNVRNYYDGERVIQQKFKELKESRGTFDPEAEAAASQVSQVANSLATNEIELNLNEIQDESESQSDSEDFYSLE